MTWDIDAIIRLAAILQKSTAEVTQLLDTAAANARNEARESLSTDNVPDDFIGLAYLAEAATGEPVLAIKNTLWSTWQPESAAPDGWSQRRLLGELRPDDPKPVKHEHHGFALITDGNPITLESWCREQGLVAAAMSPTSCSVEW